MFCARDSDYLDDLLLAVLKEASVRFELAPTPETRTAHEQAFRAFADWVLRGKLPEGPQSITPS